MATRSPLPAWAETVRRKYLSAESSLFILHLNVFDTLLYEDHGYTVENFLARVLLHDNKRNIILYDPSAGVTFLKKEDALAQIDRLVQGRSPAEVLPVLEDVLRATDSTAVILTYAGMVAPAGALHLMTEQDRINVVTLHRWSLNPELAAKDNVVFLITELLQELNPKLVSNPKVAAVEVSMPDAEQRRAVIRRTDPTLSDHQAAVLAGHTAGLKAIQITSLLAPHRQEIAEDDKRVEFIRGLLGDGRGAETRAEKLATLTRDMSRDEVRHLINPEVHTEQEQEEEDEPHAELLELIHHRKREIIDKECHGLIEFIDSGADFDAVGGYNEIKEELLTVARHIRAGDTARVPMGMLFVGPMGVGKTFVASAFANASGLSAIKLKNFRSKWVGSTEANLEKVLTLVRALGPIILIIDEGERALGSTGDSDGGTSSRVIARLKEFMSDPDNRGRVLCILMTNRPDKLDTDIKRAGRMDRKIPFFYASKVEEIESVLDALLSRYRVNRDLVWSRDRDATSDRLIGYSNADLEAVTLLAHEMAETDGSPVNAEILGRAIDDYLPPRDPQMLRYMELLAVLEASRRSLLPERYRNLSAEELGRELLALQLELGRRV